MREPTSWWAKMIATALIIYMASGFVWLAVWLVHLEFGTPMISPRLSCCLMAAIYCTSLVVSIPFAKEAE